MFWILSGMCVSFFILDIFIISHYAVWPHPLVTDSLMHRLFQLAARPVCVCVRVTHFSFRLNPVVIKVQSPAHVLLTPNGHEGSYPAVSYVDSALTHGHRPVWLVSVALLREQIGRNHFRESWTFLLDSILTGISLCWPKLRPSGL